MRFYVQSGGQASEQGAGGVDSFSVVGLRWALGSGGVRGGSALPPPPSWGGSPSRRAGARCDCYGGCFLRPLPQEITRITEPLPSVQSRLIACSTTSPIGT